MSFLALEVEAARVARDALVAQLNAFATKAASDSRYKPMAARVAQALSVLQNALQETGDQHE